MDAFLSTEQLAVGYNGKPLIREIELNLERGRILTLIGPNGAGKSTILKTLTKYLNSLHGTITIDGSSLLQMKNSELARRMSVILTQRMRTELMTCQDVVETGRYPYTGKLGILSSEDHFQVQQAMELVHAEKLRDLNFMQISDGERQRILLARAICQQPEIIVLDEPTSYLDIHYKLELLDILHVLTRERGIAVVLSLHELDMAQRIADDVLCVKGETIAHYGIAEDIFSSTLIQELYNLDNGSFNPVFGNLEMAKSKGTAQYFVIAGGGTGVPVYRTLQKNRMPFVTGILHKNDVDYQVAQYLASEVITENSFEPISDTVFTKACDRLDSCVGVINCLDNWGTINRRNQELLTYAKTIGLNLLQKDNL